MVDVREEDEYAAFNIGGELISLKHILNNAGKIKRDKKVVLHCQMGSRSKQAIHLLEEKFGFDNLYNLKGGLTAYKNMLELKKESK